MVRVAEELGVHPSSLYRHFESRDELFMALAVEYFETIQLMPFDESQWREWLLESSLQLYDVLVEFPFLIYADAFEVSRSAMAFLTEPVLKHLESVGISLDEAQSLWLGIIMLCGGAALAHARQASNPESAKQALSSLVTDPKLHDDMPRVAQLLTDPASIDLRQELRQSIAWCITGFDASRQ